MSIPPKTLTNNPPLTTLNLPVAKTVGQPSLSSSADFYTQATTTSKKPKQKEKEKDQKPWLKPLLIGGGVLGLGLAFVFLHSATKEKLLKNWSFLKKEEKPPVLGKTPEASAKIPQSLTEPVEKSSSIAEDSSGKKFEIKWGEQTYDLPPEEMAFRETLRTHLSSNNFAEAVTLVEKRVGMTIVDVGNYTPKEMHFALSALLTRKAETPGQHTLYQMPVEAKYVLFGHGMDGGDSGRPWVFAKGSVFNQSVQAHVNRTIPKGEKVWAVVCKAGTVSRFFGEDRGRNISLLEGEYITSAGV